MDKEQQQHYICIIKYQLMNKLGFKPFEKDINILFYDNKKNILHFTINNIIYKLQRQTWCNSNANYNLYISKNNKYIEL